MSDTVITVENLSKLYRLGARAAKADTLAAQMLAVLKAPVKNFRRLTSLSKFGEGDEENVLWALRDVSFTVRRGDVVGVVGHNGAGKSTLLKLLSRITHPSAGRIHIRGRVSSLLEVGTGFHPELTGRENVYMNGTILGMKRTEIERNFDAIVDFSGVERFIDTPLKRYSSGMQVRLAFAVAAHLEPEILIVDEVLAVGDTEFQRKCINKMREISQTSGRTVFFVSHNLASVESLCTTGIYLQRGQVQQTGDIHAIIRRYLGTLEQSSLVPLAERTDRSGKGGTRVHRIDVSSDDADRDSTLATGRAAVLRFHLSRFMENLQCSFSIYNERGMLVSNFNSGVLGQHDVVESQEAPQFVCRVPSVPLVPGSYRINVQILAQGEEQDRVEGAKYFEVESGVLSGRAIQKQDTNYDVVIDHRWVRPGRPG